MPHYEFAQRYGGRRHLFSAPRKRRHRAMLIGNDEQTVCRTPKSAALCKAIIPMLLFLANSRWRQHGGSSYRILGPIHGERDHRVRVAHRL